MRSLRLSAIGRVEWRVARCDRVDLAGSIVFAGRAGQPVMPGVAVFFATDSPADKNEQRPRMVARARQGNEMTRSTANAWCCAGVASAILLSGCSLERWGRSKKSACCAKPVVPCSLRTFSEEAIGEVACPRTHLLPPGVVLTDGVDEDEAIATALSNNAAFQALLTQRGMANGDLVQAGLLTNPSLQNFIPVGVKQWEWTLIAPLEPYLLRPLRVAAAEREYQRVANAVVQNGLDLVRDVRLAHVNLAAAQDRANIADEAVQLRQAIADLTARRLAQGDISELESTTARIDALNAVAADALARLDAEVAAALLGRFLGSPSATPTLVADSIRPVPPITLNAKALLGEALASRPDLRAANWAVSGANYRLKLARKAWLRIDGIVDANAKGQKGYEVGPGVRFDVPIFNRNQGGVLRAKSELMQACYTRDAITDQITQDVQTAVAQWRQAQQNLELIENEVLPALSEATKIAQKGYEDGGADYFLVLQTTSQYLDARVRQVDQRAALRRAYAELERSIGRKLETPDAFPETFITIPTTIETTPVESTPVELLPPVL